MPIPVQAIFEDGTEEVRSSDRLADVDFLTFKSKAKLKKAVLDPEKKLARLDNPLPSISPRAAEMLALGWMGLLKDLLGRRPEALTYYREALRFDTGQSMRFDQFKIRMDKDWLEERLKKPFVRER